MMDIRNLPKLNIRGSQSLNDRKKIVAERRKVPDIDFTKVLREFDQIHNQLKETSIERAEATGVKHGGPLKLK